MPRQCIATRQPVPGLERELEVAAVEQEEEVAAQVSAAAAAQAQE